jgi:hypothetical protein
MEPRRGAPFGPLKRAAALDERPRPIRMQAQSALPNLPGETHSEETL